MEKLLFSYMACRLGGLVLMGRKRGRAGDKPCVDYSWLYPGLGSVTWGDNMGVGVYSGVQITASA